MELIGKGRQAEVFALSETECVKLFYENTPINDIEREANIMEYISSLSIPTPKFFGTTQINNRHGIKMERLIGESMLNKMLNEPENIVSYAKLMGNIQTEYNSICVDKLNDQTNELKWCISKTNLLSDNDKFFICNYLDSLPKGNYLVHTDFHIDNLIVTKKGVYVIDWIGAVKGNPMADVARTYLSFVTHSYPIGASKELCNTIDSAREIIRKNYLDAYGVNVSDVETWLPVIAASRLFCAPKEEIDDDLDIICTFIKKSKL